jgi:hypothetical protein
MGIGKWGSCHLIAAPSGGALASSCCFCVMIVVCSCCFYHHDRRVVFVMFCHVVLLLLLCPQERGIAPLSHIGPPLLPRCGGVLESGIVGMSDWSEWDMCHVIWRETSRQTRRETLRKGLDEEHRSVLESRSERTHASPWHSPCTLVSVQPHFSSTLIHSSHTSLDPSLSC